MSQQSSFHRLLTLLKRLNNGKKLTITLIADEFDVSTRTVRRDFELIKDVFDDFLVKEGETYSAVQKNLLSDVLSGTDLATLASVLNVFSASGSNFKIDARLQKLFDNSKKIYQFRNKPFEELKNRDIVAKLEKAIEWRQEITINYRNFWKDRKYRLKPYKILLLNENFYLVSESDGKYKFVFSRIGLITDVQLHSNTFYPKRPIEVFIEKIQTPYAKYKPNTEDIEVIVTTDKSISKYFKMKKYLPSQRILEEREDHSLLIKYTVSDLSEITELMMKWLPKMTIQEPAELKDILRVELQDKLDSLN